MVLVETPSCKVSSEDGCIPSLTAVLAAVKSVAGAVAIEPQLENLESPICPPGVETIVMGKSDKGGG
jgi:hypothetical protein